MNEEHGDHEADTGEGPDRVLNPLRRDRVAIVADRSTATGFKLAGITHIHIIDLPVDHDRVKRTVVEVSAEPDVKFIITTEHIVDTYGFEDFEKLRKTLPEQVIVSVIPDRKGSRRKIGEGHLYKLIGRAIGLRRNL